jgi:DeoR/GlpR family transcriptional regulator of sugar metabolism
MSLYSRIKAQLTTKSLVTVSEMVATQKVSRAAVHATLRTLMSEGLVNRIGRGAYSLKSKDENSIPHLISQVKNALASLEGAQREALLLHQRAQSAAISEKKAAQALEDAKASLRKALASHNLI